MSTSRPMLDHIVILVDHSTLESLPDRLKDALVVAPGGTHADGLTVNKLILFADGVYIELIAFVRGVDPDKRKHHRWGQLRENTVIDWAYTLPHESDFAAIQQRVDEARARFRYSDPVSGGRTKPDGCVLKWAVAAPQDGNGDPSQPGMMPFWCLDRTPRKLRVPYEQDEQLTRHPCKARGVSSITVLLPKDDMSDVGKVYDAIHGSSTSSWHVEVPSGHVGSTVHMLDARNLMLELALYGPESATVEIVPGLLVCVISREGERR
ncbi:hypothetical protein HIM_04208 [Hirsutella minnesotensis 3608]|uniref:Glyoxalase-like domain-containing protein n=1 Tax=Hirsutella minnesotensis 3608 TaxID=1043627 RepID=A0A0F8A653_9HYPO|nr:hypothetical protein HIM_04208 [Hirsutella minnesotensis 3608]